MNRKSEPASKWLKPHDPVPEMELGDFVRLMKNHFSIISDYQGQPHWVRLKGPPYNSSRLYSLQYGAFIVLSMPYSWA